MDSVIFIVLSLYFIIPVGFLGVYYLDKEGIINKLVSNLLVFLIALIPIFFALGTMGRCAETLLFAIVYLAITGMALLVGLIIRWFIN